MMRDPILAALAAVEREDRVRILFACESGSRAWGFPSPDSDYDVRFIYIRARNAYLSIESPRDTIEREFPNDLDLAGWDLRKALGLLRKSNPSLLEWLESRIVYRADETFLAELRSLATRCRSDERLFRHYLSMAKSNAQSYLRGERVRAKKYLYVLRPLFACRWLEGAQGPVPMEFDSLRPRVDPAFDAALDDLLVQKSRSGEMEETLPNPDLHRFIEAELTRLPGVIPAPTGIPALEPIDTFFRRWI